MALHFCFFRPIRTLFGMFWLLAAVCCFLLAMREFRQTTAHYPPAPRTIAGDTSTDLTAELIPTKPVTATAPTPNPPRPASGARSSRPDWVDQQPHFESRGGREVYVTTASAGPYQSKGECELALGPEIDRVLADYAERNFSASAVRSLKLDRNLVQVEDRDFEPVNTSFGPMQEEHALLVIGQEIRAAIERQLRSLAVAERLQGAAMGLGAVLLLLGGVYSIVRFAPGKS